MLGNSGVFSLLRSFLKTVFVFGHLHDNKKLVQTILSRTTTVKNPEIQLTKCSLLLLSNLRSRKRSGKREVSDRAGQTDEGKL